MLSIFFCKIIEIKFTKNIWHKQIITVNRIYKLIQLKITSNQHYVTICCNKDWKDEIKRKKKTHQLTWLFPKLSIIWLSWFPSIKTQCLEDSYLGKTHAKLRELSAQIYMLKNIKIAKILIIVKIFWYLTLILFT